MKTIAKTKIEQTEIGIIPDDWDILCLGDVCSKIGSGITPRGGEKVYRDSGVALVRSQNVYNNSFNINGLVYVDEETAKEMENVALQREDVLLNITGDSVARCCTIPEEILPARVNQHVSIIRTDLDQLNPAFLRYYLTSPRMQAFMLSLSQSGGTRNALTKAMIEKFLVPKPKLEEQVAIANILYNLDAKIKTNQQMNGILEAMGRSIFKHWFIDFEFPNAERKPYKSSGGEMVYAEELGGDIPKEWRVGFLEDIALNSRHGVRPTDIDTDTPYIGLEHMPRHSIALSVWEMSDEIASNKFQFHKGDILFGKLRPYFHKVGVAPVNGICSTDILVIKPKLHEWYGFLLYYASSDELVKYADLTSSGTRMPRTNWEDLSHYQIAIPPTIIASTFNSITAMLVEKLCANIVQSRLLMDLRDSLLPKLMSGRIRVPNEAT